MGDSLKKIIRFVSIYGFQRTLFKIAGRKRISFIWILGTWWRFKKRNIAIIGCGQFGFATIGYFLLKERGCCIELCYDINPIAANSMSRALKVSRVAISAEEIIKDPKIEIVYIASNHASHAEYAIQAIQAGKRVYIEKPISVRKDQLKVLVSTLKLYKGEIYAGYNRPFSKAVNELKLICKYVSGPISLSCFITGHVISPEHWYRYPEEGTRVCGNIGHWLDLTVHILLWDELVDSWEISLNYSDKDNRDDNMSINLISGRGDLINIILTARSEPFEGINESINFQQQTVICKIDDFREIKIWNDDFYRHKYYLYKDVGHRKAILQPFDKVKRNFNEVVTSSLLTLTIMEMVVSNEQKRNIRLSELHNEIS